MLPSSTEMAPMPEPSHQPNPIEEQAEKEPTKIDPPITKGQGSGRQSTRTCALCLMPQPLTEFGDHKNKAHNCRRCERAYSLLYVREKVSMAKVRGNIHRIGGPQLLVRAYKRKGLAALEDCTMEGGPRGRKGSRTEAVERPLVWGQPKSTDGCGAPDSDSKAAETGSGDQTGNTTAPESNTVCRVPASGQNTNQQGGAAHIEPESLGAQQQQQQQPWVPNHPSAEELGALGQFGEITVIEGRSGRGFVYKRYPVSQSYS